MIHFGQDGRPEATTEFQYPDDEPTCTGSTGGQSPFQYRAEGFRLALLFLRQARGANARNIMLEAACHIMERTETATNIAKRLGVSLEHFSRTVAKVNTARAILRSKDGHSDAPHRSEISSAPH